jgi:GNAT superfamily N-acetyltransferase
MSIPPQQVTAGLRALHPRSGLTYRRGLAVLDGKAGGTILTDDPVRPTWLAVHERSDDVLVLGGALSAECVAEIIARQLGERTVIIGMDPDDPRWACVPTHPELDSWGLDFEDRDPAVDLEPLSVPPAGLRLARIDAELAARCAWPPSMFALPESALSDGVGFCLLDGEQVVAEAYAGPLVEGCFEMGTITHQDYRRRGLATIVCARTISACERLGYRTWWNTAHTNTGSIALARKLGYRTEHVFRLVAWFVPSRREPRA